MKLFFCCSDRFISIKALNYIIEQDDVDIVAVLLDEVRECSYVPEYCKSHGIRMFLRNQLEHVHENHPEGSCDWLFSFTYGFKLSQRTIDIGKKAVNFHGALLPQWRGTAVTSWALYLGEKEWGVTTHFLSAELDKGDIIFQKKFFIDRNIIKTGHDLSVYVTHMKLECMKELVRKITDGEEIRGERQAEGKYYSQKDLEKLKEIKLDDSVNDIDRKIEALWYPPYGGCYIMIGGKKYYLVNETVLNQCSQKYLFMDEQEEKDLL